MLRFQIAPCGISVLREAIHHDREMLRPDLGATRRLVGNVDDAVLSDARLLGQRGHRREEQRGRNEVSPAPVVRRHLNLKVRRA